MTTYSCRTDALEITPGQNTNLIGLTKTCPHAEVVSVPVNLCARVPDAVTDEEALAKAEMSGWTTVSVSYDANAYSREFIARARSE